MDPPYAEEQPEAFVMYIRSPNSWVTSLMYGVSPQPAQAPENSKYGFANCEFFTLFAFTASFLISTSSTA